MQYVEILLKKKKRQRNRVIKQIRNTAINQILKMFDKNGKFKRVVREPYDDTPDIYYIESILSKSKVDIKNVYDRFNKEELYLSEKYKTKY